ncbi:dehydratase [Tepidamorphus sp. 3E244]|uniref:dehydratase n=1 Tax=Tepidamorphus sp. 3E244 TaxID=3385498 RepID=UPI0038FD2751
MLFFEDFPKGEVTTFGALKVTADDIRAYAERYDPSVLDPGLPSFDGEPAASPWHVCAMMMKIICDNFILDTASVGAPGIERLEWDEPVRAGDVLHIRRTTLETRKSASRPGLGLVQFRFEVFAGETRKMVEDNWVMFTTRDAGAGA